MPFYVILGCNLFNGNYSCCPLQGSSQYEEVTVEVDQGIVFPLLTSGTSDADVGEVSMMSYCIA